MEQAGRLGCVATRGAWTVKVVNPDSDRPGGTPGAASSAVESAGSRSEPGLGDADLVTAALAGRREAFDEIVARHGRMVYRVCFRFTGNHEDASDLAQDVFLRAYRGLRSFRGGSALSTWLYRIAVNASLNHVAARRPVADDLDPSKHVDAGSLSPDDGVWQQQKGARVRAAIRQLPDRQRATVILRVYHELTHEEIARVFGSSVGTVKANFFHALRNLKGLLGTSEPRR